LPEPARYADPLRRNQAEQVARIAMRPSSQ
jgi:hypothetical protein